MSPANEGEGMRNPLIKNIGKTAKKFATTLQHVINCLKNSEGCFIATHSLLRTKLDFLKEPHLSSIFFESIEKNHFIYFTKSGEQCYASVIIFIFGFGSPTFE